MAHPQRAPGGCGYCGTHVGQERALAWQELCEEVEKGVFLTWATEKKIFFVPAAGGELLLSPLPVINYCAHARGSAYMC